MCVYIYIYIYIHIHIFNIDVIFVCEIFVPGQRSTNYNTKEGGFVFFISNKEFLPNP